MNSNWWRKFDELDPSQKAFISLPIDGRHLLEGPPGSGKTNLLLLRAEYLAGRGEKNVLILTYTKALRNFISSGIGARKLITPQQVKTYHSWAFEHITHHLGTRLVEKGAVFNDETRTRTVELLQEANKKIDSTKQYSAIFVDEAQDLSLAELKQLLCLSDRICICGDTKQGIYQQDGLDIAKLLGLESHKLERHFRIGHRIARVADRLSPVDAGVPTLEESSNYDRAKYGESRAQMYPCESRDEQFSKMLEILRVQVDAYNEDTIGIFCGKNETIVELKERFSATELIDSICFHGGNENSDFSGKHRIHVITIHSAKGTEFRAVHLYATEELANHPLHRTRIAYTAITRAKTTLSAYRTGDTNRRLENAFAEETHFEPEDLFD
ncbi:MAG: ATP-dependent helicase [Candidatus Obscuribacterales bacterium]|nr:ATP-dependent helicase [Candidatus Obscuribacterales bacterium]